MELKIIGPRPGAVDPATGRPPKVGTLAVNHRALITTAPAVHACQRNDFIQQLNEERQAKGAPPLTSQEEREVHSQCISLFFDHDTVLIRPDLNSMDLAIQADELLQSLVPKHRIRFLHARQPMVRDALRARGELWRISEPPRTVTEMEEFIQGSLVAISGRAIYRINPTTGTRWLTVHQLRELRHLTPSDLEAQLKEIFHFAYRHNRASQPELRLFGIGDGRIPPMLAAAFEETPMSDIHRFHTEMVETLTAQAPPDLRRDDPKNAVWREGMFANLTTDPDGPSAPDVVDGLSEAFRRQVLWLPGGCFEAGELRMDPIFERSAEAASDRELRQLCDSHVKGFIPNFLREFGEIDYVNVGRVLSAVTAKSRGRRAVYLAEIKPKGATDRVLRVLRMHRWGIVEHLRDHDDLLNAILKAHEYIHYVLDRRLACRQLGMNVPLRVSCWDIPEDYVDSNGGVMEVWASYYERDYLPGTAANKISESKLAREDYALQLARLLGEAAAPNLIVGRAEENTIKSIFDAGDELVLEDPSGLPSEIVVCDHSRSFGNFRDPLDKLIGGYLQPVLSRLHLVPSPNRFAEAYVAGFEQRLLEIHKDYILRKNAFRTLFGNQTADAAGNFRHRWLEVLNRLESTDVLKLSELLRKRIP